MTLLHLSFTPPNHPQMGPAHHSLRARRQSAQRLQMAKEASSDRPIPSPGLDSHPKPNPSHWLP